MPSHPDALPMPSRRRPVAWTDHALPSAHDAGFQPARTNPPATSEHAVRTEFEPLNAVRVHTPGLELWSGSVDPGPNLFEEGVPPDRARREHGRLVESLETDGVDVLDQL
jgi:hypothetical protein